MFLGRTRDKRAGYPFGSLLLRRSGLLLFEKTAGI
jgi:hypothetical protein